MASVAAPTAAVGHRELYDDLCKKLKEVERLSGIQALLSWDEQVCVRAWWALGIGEGLGDSSVNSLSFLSHFTA